MPHIQAFNCRKTKTPPRTKRGTSEHSEKLRAVQQKRRAAEKAKKPQKPERTKKTISPAMQAWNERKRAEMAAAGVSGCSPCRWQEYKMGRKPLPPGATIHGKPAEARA
ncbi:hypothetical protein ACO2I3_01110 [Leptospira interrogans]